MEFLKEFLGDDLYAQVEAKLKDNENVKLANLASGEYVSKSKYDDKEEELKTANAQLANLSETVKKFEGEDIESLKKQLTDSQEKYDNDISALQTTMKKMAAVDSWLDAHPSKHRNLLKAQFNLDKIEIEKDGTMKGLDEQGKTLAETYKDMFIIEQPKAGGMPQGGTPNTKDPGQMSMDEYKAWRAKQ